MSTEHFSSVGDGVWVLDPRVGADTMAVLGAMMSRTPDLGLKWDALVADVAGSGESVDWDFRNPPPRILEFLAKNIGGYSHASIASMAKAILVYVQGMGWPGAWLLEDFPLFDGQEVSTRAVDGGAIPGATGPGTLCRYAPLSLAPLHEAWMARYTEAKVGVTRGGYKFDEIRVLLPGTVPSGVVLTQDVRALSRHLDHLSGLGPFGAALAEQVYTGLRVAAPVTTNAIGGKCRAPHSAWRVGVARIDGARTMAVDGGVRVTPWETAMPGVYERLMERTAPRAGANTHLDPLWRHAPRVEMSIVCTIAAARDFHRHRPSMPWSLDIVHDATTNEPVFAPWYATASLVDGGLWEATCRAYRSLGGVAEGRDPEGRQWEALHALPFGTLVRLSAVMTLPDALYMLELRSTVPGANAEYRAQARRGLADLCAVLPKALVERDHLDAALGGPEAVIL